MHVLPADEDIDYLLHAVNEFFGTALGRERIAGAFAGVRPLISSTDSKSSVDISRKAELYETSSGMVTITGGKLTTWRRMAKMTVDRLVERDARDAPCRTHEIPLGQAIDADELERVDGVAEAAYAALAARYGHQAVDVLRIAAERRSSPRRSSRACPTCSPRRSTAARREQARGHRRRAAAPHAARPARGPRGRRARARSSASPTRSATELGWDGGAARGGDRRASRTEAAAEGIVVDLVAA